MQMIRPTTGASLPALLARVLLAALIGLEPGVLSLAQAASPPAAAERVVERSIAPPIIPALMPSATTSAATLSSRDAPSDPAPEGSPPLRIASDGITAVAGRVLATDGTPLQGVVLRFGAVRTRTDQNGLYILENVAPGEAVLVIDGRQAREPNASESVDHGMHETRVRAEAGRTTALPWVSWLPRIDHANEVVLNVPSTEDAVARTPAVPGLELRIPKGAVLTGIDGEAVTRVGLTAIPINRPPFPLPRNVEVPVYFTAQPGGAVISSTDGQWLGMQVVYPNYGKALPKARGVFWRYEPDGLGWSPYGLGTVTADGSQVVPDPATRIYALSGAMFSEGGAPPPKGPNPPNTPPANNPPAGSPPPGGPPPVAGPPKAPPPPKAGDPVDLASGFYVQEQTDLYVDDALPIDVMRTYRPGDYNRRAFGIGMSLSYSSVLYSANQYQVVDLIQPDGGLVHYTRIINPANPTDNDWVTAHFITNSPGPFYQSRIDWNGDGWNLIRTDGMLYVFGENAPLQNIQDRFGNKITFTRSDGIRGNITQVSSSNGRFIRFSYDSNNCITQAVDNIGRTMSYTYDSSSRLTTVTDPNGGVTTYTWDSSNRVQSIQDARGVTTITNTYDANDRITNQGLPGGVAFQFAYTLNGNGNVTKTTVTDPRGYVREMTFNNAGYSLTDRWAVGTPQEATWSYTLDPVSNLPLSLTDPLGRRTDTNYDSQGNVVSVTQLVGTPSAATTSYTYDPIFNQITSITDPLSHTTTYQRNALGQMTSRTDALGHTWSYTYNIQGRWLTFTDPLTHITQRNFGLDGDPVSVTDPLGRTGMFYTDPIGRAVRAADPVGGSTLIVHDPINGVSQFTDGNGNKIVNTYTPIGKLASVTDPRNGKITYAYDSLARLANWTDANGAVESVTQRSGTGYVLSSTDRNGQVTTFTYDVLNRLVAVTYADSSTVALTWDLGDRLTNVQDSTGGTITRAYDDLDRVVSEITPQGMVTYTYDAAGRRLTMQAGNQVQVSYSYDAGNRLTGITQGGTSVSFGYDAANRRTSAVLPGGITAAYSFDVASQLTSISYDNGSTNLGTLTYGYDLAGHIVSRGGTLFQSILPEAVTNASYDLANRLTSRTAAGVTANPTWDSNGNMTSDGVRTYTWDARDRLTGITGVASFGYDAANRRQTAIRSGTATSFLYDRWEVAQEQQGGSASADLLLGLGSDERLKRGSSTLLADVLGSTVALASSGAVQTSYGYDVYGATQTTGAASTNTFQFTGRENDGTGLYNYRSRYYNPAWGRFISEDQLGIKGGDVNLYRYVSNDPINYADPSGNCGPACVVLAGAAVGAVAGALTGAYGAWAGGDPCAPVDWKGIGYGALGGAIGGGIIGGASAVGAFGGSLGSSLAWTSATSMAGMYAGNAVGTLRGGPPGMPGVGRGCNYPNN
jgi:RHS repeat-associated protein